MYVHGEDMYSAVYYNNILHTLSLLHYCIAALNSGLFLLSVSTSLLKLILRMMALSIYNNSFILQIIQDWHMMLVIGLLLMIDVVFLTIVTAVPEAILTAELTRDTKTVR